jgi:hypothetical protein
MLTAEALMKNLPACALLILWLAGCQGSLVQIEGDENSRDFRIPVDSKLVLQQDLWVPARSDRLYFQKGKVLLFQNVNEYLPYCALSLYVMVAGLTPGGGMTYQVVAILLELRSVKQPDIIRMTCANRGLPQDLAHLTLGQMRESLGDIFLLEMPKRNDQ